jgi:DNA-binding response OmpR family regulator
MNTQTQAVSKTIIVVDDDESIQEMLKVTLEHNGFQVICARNSKDILALQKQYQPVLVIMDLIMPEHEGVEGIFALMAASQVPIIAISSNVRFLNLVEHIVPLALIKPFSAEIVLNGVSQILGVHSKSTKT